MWSRVWGLSNIKHVKNMRHAHVLSMRAVGIIIFILIRGKKTLLYSALSPILFNEMHPSLSGREHRTHNATSIVTSLVRIQLDAIYAFVV